MSLYAENVGSDRPTGPGLHACGPFWRVSVLVADAENMNLLCVYEGGSRGESPPGAALVLPIYVPTHDPTIHGQRDCGWRIFSEIGCRRRKPTELREMEGLDEWG